MSIKYFSLILSVLLFFLSKNSKAQGPFAPGADEAGTTAIHMSDSRFVAWANQIEVVRGWTNISDQTELASYGEPENAIGQAVGDSYNVVSLGDGGTATFYFSNPIVNGEGADFAVFENGFADNFLELAFVEVSSDGENFVRFPAVSLTPTNEQVGDYGTLDPTYIHNLAGKYRQGYGTPFDLEDIVNEPSIDVNNICWIRIVDVVGSIDTQFGSYDSEENLVNDPFPTPYSNCGFDLEALGVINQQNTQAIQPESNFEILVYPNPFCENIYIESEDNAVIFFYNSLGQLILSQTVKKGKNTIELSGFKKGVYLIKIYNKKYDVLKTVNLVKASK